MTPGTSIRHALYAVIDLARSDESNPVSVASIAQRRGIPETALAKVFQRLVRSGLVVGMRGPHGGYRLARPASEITVLDVMDVFSPAQSDARLPDDLGRDEKLEEFIGTVDGQARSAFASVTIDQLAAQDKTSI
jgi:Rrf2 family protein